MTCDRARPSEDARPQGATLRTGPSAGMETEWVMTAGSRM
jgi:hypothetical protein